MQFKGNIYQNSFENILRRGPKEGVEAIKKIGKDFEKVGKEIKEQFKEIGDAFKKELNGESSAGSQEAGSDSLPLDALEEIFSDVTEN